MPSSGSTSQSEVVSETIGWRCLAVIRSTHSQTGEFIEFRIETVVGSMNHIPTYIYTLGMLHNSAHRSRRFIYANK